MTKETAIALLNNQLKTYNFNFNNPVKIIWHDNLSYTLKELIKIAYDLK